MRAAAVVAAVLVSTLGSSSHAAFVPSLSTSGLGRPAVASPLVLHGYLDDLSAELNKKAEEEYDPEKDSREYNEKKRSEIDRYGPGTWDDFKDFDEFDGGDGQMGVAGDGNKGLEKIGGSPTLASSMGKSKMMSAKNAWGTSSGYADELLQKDPKMDVSRAQQFENWQNQREVHRKNQFVAEMEMADSERREAGEMDWRELAKFGVDRNQDFDLDSEFGPVTAGDLEGTIEMKANLQALAFHEFGLKNPYMGFSDFRAAMTPDSNPAFTVEPNEGSLSKEPTNFIIKFRGMPGVSEGHLVIETEDFKKTWKIIGSSG